MTPDHNALIGEVMRDLHLTMMPSLDVSGLNANRFAGSEVRPELNIV